MQVVRLVPDTDWSQNNGQRVEVVGQAFSVKTKMNPDGEARVRVGNENRQVLVMGVQQWAPSVEGLQVCLQGKLIVRTMKEGRVDDKGRWVDDDGVPIQGYGHSATVYELIDSTWSIVP